MKAVSRTCVIVMWDIPMREGGKKKPNVRQPIQPSGALRLKAVSGQKPGEAEYATLNNVQLHKTY